jgi:HPr kinase/phosphorylase
MKTPDPTYTAVTVGDFFSRHSAALQVETVLTGANGAERSRGDGADRLIREPTVNRPGLALSGFYTYFAEKRIQVLGAAEISYLASLSESDARERCRTLCAQQIPCLVVARGKEAPGVLAEEAAAAGVTVYRSRMVTMNFINAATMALAHEFAPTKSEYGSMVDILGVGTLVRGSSGIGKSECVLGLVERGHSLVSDDITRFKAMEGRELLGTSPELTRHHMEVRGLGVINIMSIFGAGSVRLEKRLDLVVTLKDWNEIADIDRTGLDQEFYEVLGILVPHVTIPVRMGRDLARLVEVAALDQKLKTMGHHSAQDFNERLVRMIQRNKKS